MSIERGGPSEEEILKWEKQRTLSDANLIQRGAKYKISKNEKGEISPVLEVTPVQIEDARDEMTDALEAPKRAKELLNEINTQTDEQLDKDNDWSKVSNAIVLCKKANMIEEARFLSKRLGDYLGREFEKLFMSDLDSETKMHRLTQEAKEWVAHLKDSGNTEALEQAKTRMREVLDEDSQKQALG